MRRKTLLAGGLVFLAHAAFADLRVIIIDESALPYDLVLQNMRIAHQNMKIQRVSMKTPSRNMIIQKANIATQLQITRTVQVEIED